MDTVVSIIMPAYGMGAFIGEALESIARQTYARWELIVVDDCGPDDGTQALIKAFVTNCPQQRVEYIRHEQNRGVSAARNTAIAAATGEVLAFLDADDLWQPRHLENAVQTFADFADFSVVTSPVEAFGGKGEGTKAEYWHFDDWKLRHFPASLATHNFIQPSATLVRRATVAEIGGFDISPGLQHIEDYDLWIRLVELGHQFYFLGEVTCRYRKHEAAATSNVMQMRRRHDALGQKHAGFFLRMHGQLLAAAHEDIGKLKTIAASPWRWLLDQGKQRVRNMLANRRSG